MQPPSEVSGAEVSEEKGGGGKNSRAASEAAVQGEQGFMESRADLPLRSFFFFFLLHFPFLSNIQLTFCIVYRLPTG